MISDTISDKDLEHFTKFMDKDCPFNSSGPDDRLWTLIQTGHFTINPWKFWEIDRQPNLISEERFLPKLLVDAGLFGSNGEVKRHNASLFTKLKDTDYGILLISLPKGKLYLPKRFAAVAVGAPTEELMWKIIEEDNIQG